MNFVGRILVVFILIASLAFMMVTFMAFSAQKNWREEAQSLQAQLSERDGRITELDGQIALLKTAIQTDVAEQKQWLAACESRYAQEHQQLAAAQRRVQTLSDEKTKAMSNVETLTTRLADNDKLLAETQTQLNDAVKARTTSLAQVTAHETAIAELNLEVETLSGRNREIATDLAAYRQALAANGIQLDDNIAVEGIITRVDESNNVQLSIGFDDGLEKGMVLDVYRYADGALGEPKWLGKVEIVATDADASVARIVPDINRGGRIQVNDLVANLRTP